MNRTMTMEHIDVMKLAGKEERRGFVAPIHSSYLEKIKTKKCAVHGWPHADGYVCEEATLSTGG